MREPAPFQITYLNVLSTISWLKDLNFWNFRFSGSPQKIEAKPSLQKALDYQLPLRNVQFLLRPCSRYFFPGSNDQFWNYKSWVLSNFLTNQIVFDKLHSEWIIKPLKLVLIGQKIRICIFGIGEHCTLQARAVHKKSKIND